MAIQKDEAFILNRIPLRETSLIVTLFSKRSGKIKLLAKGVRQEKSSRAAAFEPFTRVSVVYYEKTRSDLHLASHTEILNAYSELRGRLDLIGCASYLVELVNTLFGVHDPHEEVFELLDQCFELLPNAAVHLISRIFEVKVLSHIGWLPVLTQCAVCGEKILNQVYFSPRQGGVLCRRCDHGEAGTILISNGSRQSLVYFLKHEVRDAARLKISKQLQAELARIGETFVHYHLEYPLKTTKFLSELEVLRRH